MKAVVAPRAGGKTTELIKMANKEWLYIVCIDRRAVENTANLARQLGIDIPFPITFEDLVYGRFHPPGIKGFLVDDVDVFLRQRSRGVPIHAIAVTGEHLNPDKEESP
jgi:hypothetical protein